METTPSAGGPSTSASATHGPATVANRSSTTRRRSAPSARQKPAQTGLPKGINYKLLRALKPGKQRQAYLNRLRKRHGVVIPQKRTEIDPKAPIVHQPWLPVDTNEPLTATSQPGTTKAGVSHGSAKRRRKVLEEKEHKGLNAGSECHGSVNNFRAKQGLEVKPMSPVLTNFVWPSGMSRKEFLAKKPGKDRMAYLARYMKKNDVELQKIAPVRPGAPIGRKLEPLSHPRCGCSGSEACASCSRCVELHCVCGLTGRRRRALCQESRACSCTLIDPTKRCELCYGCRQTHGFSHCRCVLHQRMSWIKRHPELGTTLTEEEEKAVCSCYLLAHRYGGAAATKEKEEDAREKNERVRAIKRAAGFPSSDNIYRSKKVTTFLGDEGLESEYDDGVDDGPGLEMLPPSANGVIPRTMTARMLGAEYHPASYHPLFRSEGCSLLESIEPRNGRVRCRSAPAAFSSDAMQEEICRGLENYVFELDRDAALPPDDLVEYVIYMASIKASNVGELIGTFDDSAAVAVGIVIEEYMKQLIEDHVLQQQPLCPPSKTSVQAFTRDILYGFNWQLFQRQHLLSCSKTEDPVAARVDKEAMLKDKVARLILYEFVSLQPQEFDEKDHDLLTWIRNAVAIPPSVVTGTAMCQSSLDKEDDQHSEEASSRSASCQDPEVGKAIGTPQIRMSVRANPVHGKPSYKLHYTTTLHDGHRAEIAVGGIDSKVKANATILQLAKVVRRQEQRSTDMLQDPRLVSRPPPVLQPPPCKDEEDPYSSMFEHVWKHFNEYAFRKWQASTDINCSSMLSDHQDLTASPGETAKRQSKSPPMRQLRQKNSDSAV
uniref:Uncharacterized protein n=1 Tax=Peronospora matthiolae TaxID=2874970 RepID=A0AAV1UJ97_9STRA